jgi:hypothetical protein
MQVIVAHQVVHRALSRGDQQQDSQMVRLYFPVA